MTDVFVHPNTKMVLTQDSDGNLFCLEGNKREVFTSQEGCYDFVLNPSLKEMKRVYDESYSQWPMYDLTLETVTKPWFDNTMPWNRTMLKSLGSLSGRKVLLLGNGMQFKEHYFLYLGAQVVYTDLSIVAAKRAQSVFRKSELWDKHGKNIQFHAVDGMHLPFPDETFDIIYGHKFVGFLNNIPQFLSEAKRCLKPNGICRFNDDAYSPAWEAVRHVISQPIKVLRWKFMSDLDRIRSGGAPTGGFGFKEESLTPIIEQVGFKRLVFIREYFFLRAAQAFWANLFSWKASRLKYAKPFFLSMKWIDDRLRHTEWIHRNAIHLIWGADK